MTVLGTDSRVAFSPSGGTVYPLGSGFLFFAETDLVVVRTDALGVETILALITDYTVSGGDGNTGSVTTVATYSDGTLVIYRSMEIKQQYDAEVGDGFNTDTFEAQLDRTIMMVQEIQRSSSGSFRLPDSYAGAASTVLPSPDALKYFRWNSDATGLELSPGISNIADVAEAGILAYDTLTELAGAYISIGAVAFLRGRDAIGDGASGLFIWAATDLSVEVAADTLSGIYVAPTLYPTGASGAWVRQYAGDLMPEWFGATRSFLNDSTAAFNAAIALSKTLTSVPKSILLSDKYLINGTILMDHDGIKLFGLGSETSQLKFNPSSSSTMILIQAETSTELIQEVSLKDFGILATYPDSNQKTAINISDGSFIEIENVNTPDWSWTGADSQFLLFNGRDQHTVRNCYIAADRPIVVGKNPNSTQYQFDVYHFQDLSMQTLKITGYAITFLPGVNISQWIMDGRCIALTGTGGIFLNDTETGTAASSNIIIRNFRIESGSASGGAAGGYGIQMTFGASNPKCGNITISNSSVNDGSCNGYYFDGVASMLLSDLNCGFASANAALTLKNVGRAIIQNLGIGHNAAIVSMATMHERYISKPYTVISTGNPSVSFGLYEFYDTDTTNRNLIYINGVRHWGRSETIGNAGSIEFPALPAAGSSMIVTVSCNFGYAQYYIDYTTATLISGTAGFGVAGAGNITVIASGGGVSALTNSSAGNQDFIITSVGS